MAAVTKKDIWGVLHSIPIEKDLLEYRTVDYGDDATSIAYISIHIAHELMMQHYPEYSWAFAEDDLRRECHYFNDGSTEVRVSMTVEGHTIHTSLNVTNSNGAETKTPSAKDIHNTKQRCRVKAMGEFGLYYDLWVHPESYMRKQAEDKPPVLNLMKTSPAKDVGELDRYWLNLESSPSRASAEKIKTQIENQLRVMKGQATYTSDDIKNRWAKTCKAKGWKI